MLAELRPGDTLTHCFKPFPDGPCTADGRVKEACWLDSVVVGGALWHEAGAPGRALAAE